MTPAESRMRNPPRHCASHSGLELDPGTDFRLQRGAMEMTSKLMERAGMIMPGMGTPAMGTGMMGSTGPMPAGMNMMMVPRCTMKMEKCSGGMKITCTSDDATSAGML